MTPDKEIEKTIEFSGDFSNELGMQITSEGVHDFLNAKDFKISFKLSTNAWDGHVQISIAKSTIPTTYIYCFLPIKDILEIAKFCQTNNLDKAKESNEQ